MLQPSVEALAVLPHLWTYTYSSKLILLKNYKSQILESTKSFNNGKNYFGRKWKLVMNHSPDTRNVKPSCCSICSNKNAMFICTETIYRLHWAKAQKANKSEASKKIGWFSDNNHICRLRMEVSALARNKKVNFGLISPKETNVNHKLGRNNTLSNLNLLCKRYQCFNQITLCRWIPRSTTTK